MNSLPVFWPIVRNMMVVYHQPRHLDLVVGRTIFMLQLQILEGAMDFHILLPTLGK